MFLTLSSIPKGLEFWSVNQASIYENSELKIFQNIKLLVEIFNNWPNDLLRRNVNKTFESCIVENVTMDYYYFRNF